MRGRIAGLDLIRGIAIALVLLRHAWPDVFGSAGIVGVVAFFTLSGYLITGLLLSDIRRLGRVRYGRFYRNRAIRLLPSLLLMLAGLIVVTLAWDPLDERDGLARAVLVALTYTGNIPFDLGSSAIDHLWTLATEEQFYIVWPIILTFAVRYRKMGLVIAVSAVALLAVLAATLILTSPDVHRVYRLPSSWAVAMVAGAAARVWHDQISAMIPTGKRGRTTIGALAVLVLLAAGSLPEGKDNPMSYFVLGPVVAVVTLALIFAWSSWRELPTVALRPLLSLGTVSYAAYLWNYPVVLWLGASVQSRWVPILGIVITILAAAASWWLVEVPAHRLRLALDGRASRSTATLPPI
jgi:peptidoglycan/LPS O-acetylase OafA/YrhL